MGCKTNTPWHSLWPCKLLKQDKLRQVTNSQRKDEGDIKKKGDFLEKISCQAVASKGKECVFDGKKNLSRYFQVEVKNQLVQAKAVGEFLDKGIWIANCQYIQNCSFPSVSFNDIFHELFQMVWCFLFLSLVKQNTLYEGSSNQGDHTWNTPPGTTLLMGMLCGCYRAARLRDPLNHRCSLGEVCWLSHCSMPFERCLGNP